MAARDVEAEIVDLTQEGTSKDEPPPLITLNDSINQPEPAQPERRETIRLRGFVANNPNLTIQHQRRTERRIDVVELIDSGEESDLDLIEPCRKRRRPTSDKSTQVLPSRRPPDITPRPPPPSPDNSLKCPICLETFKNIIKRNISKCVTTKCGHLFCENCLKKAFVENGRKCPKCRTNMPRGAGAMIALYDIL